MRGYEAAYCHTEPCRDEEIRLALRWLAERVPQGGPRILVVASGLDVAGRSAVIQRTAGSLQIESERTFAKKRYSWRGTAALALWPTAKMLALLDETPDLAALAAVPWQLKGLDAWRASRRPIDLLGVAEQAAVPSIADPVVRVALEHLTLSVNLGTGLTHPSDKDHAIETFRALRKAGHLWNPDKLHAWALATGWTNDGADDLRKYAAGILDGRRFQTKGQYGLRSDVVEHWRREAADSGDG